MQWNIVHCWLSAPMMEAVSIGSKAQIRFPCSHKQGAGLLLSKLSPSLRCYSSTTSSTSNDRPNFYEQKPKGGFSTQQSREADMGRKGMVLGPAKDQGAWVSLDSPVSPEAQARWTWVYLYLSLWAGWSGFATAESANMVLSCFQRQQTKSVSCSATTCAEKRTLTSSASTTKVSPPSPHRTKGPHHNWNLNTRTLSEVKGLLFRKI